jgi:hypothetical protein
MIRRQPATVVKNFLLLHGFKFQRHSCLQNGCFITNVSEVIGISLANLLQGVVAKTRRFDSETLVKSATFLQYSIS